MRQACRSSTHADRRAFELIGPSGLRNKCIHPNSSSSHPRVLNANSAQHVALQNVTARIISRNEHFPTHFVFFVLEAFSTINVLTCESCVVFGPKQYAVRAKCWRASVLGAPGTPYGFRGFQGPRGVRDTRRCRRPGHPNRYRAWAGVSILLVESNNWRCCAVRHKDATRGRRSASCDRETSG